ncbi:MAG TPA: hypothetical protein OIM63_05205 [Bacilli bacterium]|jgi:magnesium-transporting ATPase (P-type)|nr:hypothetical protein [Bacilli bacterium]
MNNSIFEKIKETNIEDIIWLTYFFTIIANLYSNYLERDYIKNNNIRSRNLFRQINLYVLVIAFFIYLYFVFLSYKSIRNLRSNATQKKVFLTNLTLISALLFLIAGALNIFIQKNSIYDDEIGLI